MQGLAVHCLGRANRDRRCAWRSALQRGLWHGWRKLTKHYAVDRQELNPPAGC